MINWSIIIIIQLEKFQSTLESEIKSLESQDVNEIEAIHLVFSDCIDTVNVYSSKGALGHLLAGAAAVDTVLGIYMLKNGVIPPTLNSLLSDKNIKFNLVNKSLLRAIPKRIMVNCQSYEGQCASLIIEAVK